MTEYAKAVKKLAELEGIETANTANHKALEKKIITMDQFREGARVLAQMVLDR